MVRSARAASGDWVAWVQDEQGVVLFVSSGWADRVAAVASVYAYLRFGGYAVMGV